MYVRLDKANNKNNLDRLIRRLEPKIRRSFLESIHRIKSSVSLKEIEEFLIKGQVDRALDSLDKAISRLADDIVSFTVIAGKSTSELIDRTIDISISFDQTNLRAVNMMRQNKLRLVREFTEEQRRVTREAITEGIMNGINPKAQARVFRDSIGLTSRQLKAVSNYRRLLVNHDKEALTRALRDKRFDRTLLSAIENGRPLTNQQIDTMVNRYRERYIAYRAKVIARTEALRSAHQGTEEMFTQAIESGNLDHNKLTRTWVTARDERVRGSHAAMNGQKQPYGSPFLTGNGYKLMFPGDPSGPASEVIQCRCIVTTRFN